MTRGNSTPDADEKRPISHRFRNLLHGAKLQLALLEHELRGAAVTPGAREAASAVRLQIDQLAALIGELSAELEEGRSR